jgi:transposase
LAKAKPAVVAIEGCGSSHYWGRYAQSFNHDVRIISHKKVKGFLQGHKTDANDALPIANASLQIGMKSSKPKTEQQQTIQTLETSRFHLSRSITSLSNHLRSMLYEYGIVSARGIKALTTVVFDTLNDADSMPECLRSTVNQLWLTYLRLKEELAQLIKTRNALIRQLQPCKKLMDLKGIAKVCAGLLYSSIGDGKQFKNGREASAFVGLTPKQHSSGGTIFMTGIYRAGGIRELRSALYQGRFLISAIYWMSLKQPKKHG